MLASITPLGERSRGSSWTVTASAFALGAVGAGALGGSVLGWLGGLAGLGGVSAAMRAALVLGVLLLVLLFDAPGSRLPLPSSRRQVNEDWLGRYRGWVYGIGFGAQLGVGVVTIVSSAAVYAAAGLAVLGGAAGGAIIGVAFGLVRALSLVPARAVQDPQRLARLHHRLVVLERPVARGAVAAEAVALVAVAALAVGGRWFG